MTQAATQCCEACQPLHKRDCELDDCDGCFSRPAAVGIRVCESCEAKTREGLQALGALYGGLLERPRLSGASTGRSDVPAEPLAEAALNARWDIDVLLRRWVDTVARARDITPPDLNAAQAALKRAMADELILAAQARLRGRHEPASAHLERAQVHGLALADGSWAVSHQADWLDRHATWLLTGTHAEAFARNVIKVHRDAIQAAHPNRPEPRIPCACGAYVRVHPTDDMQCPGCQQHGVLTWWTTHAPTPGPMRLSYLREWLLTRGLDIPTKTLETWSTRGQITPTEPGSRGRGLAARYEPTAVYLIAIEATRRTA